MTEPIPYMVHESAMARLERTIRRLWILCIIIFLAFVVSNGAWIYYESQFTDEVTEITQTVDSDNRGVSSISGDINIQ